MLGGDGQHAGHRGKPVEVADHPSGTNVEHHELSRAHMRDEQAPGTWLEALIVEAGRAPGQRDVAH